MITAADFYHVMTAMVPLYVAMILAYGSVKWWKIFTPDQCSGINRFVALFAVPLLSFHFISTNDPYTMNFRFIIADTLQKLIVLGLLAVWANLSRRGCLEWTITLFSLSTLPNTLVMGIPLLKGMYGEFSGSLMVQIVVLQCIIWYTLMLFMFEYRGARMLITEQFPGTAGSIVSFKVDSDVMSLDGREPLQTEAEVGEDGKLHVTVRKSTSSRSEIFSRHQGLTPRPSNLTNAEIYSLQSSRNPTPRGSSFNHTDFYSMVTGAGGRSPRHSSFGTGDGFSKGPTPRPSNYEEDSHHYHHHPGSLPPPPSRGRFATGAVQYPAPNTGMFSPKQQQPSGQPAVVLGKANSGAFQTMPSDEPGKDLHMFVWSSSASPVSEAGLHHVFGSHSEYGNDQNVKEVKTNSSATKGEMNWEDYQREGFTFGNAGVLQGDEREGQVKVEMEPNDRDGKPTSMPPASVMTRLILIMVWRKLIRNPNTYSSLVGLTWSLVSFKWNVSMPAIIAKSISILSDAGLGMAMFSLGLFMALQPRIIACGNRIAAFSMAVRFLAGPAVMAAASIAVGLRGVLLHVAVVQAALPQGIVPFVFAKEYNVHPDILSTGVIFGMLIALPITLVYYIVLGL
ncbi:unnamed protein product [Victoria cruziana]